MPMEIPPIPGLTNQPQINYGTDLSPLFAQIYNISLDYFKSPDFAHTIGIVKTVAAILTIVLGAVLAVIMVKMSGLVKEEFLELKGRVNPPKEAVSPYDSRWREIRNHATSFKESEWKLAVIEADKLVDDALKAAGFAGESMGERLMLIKPDQLLNLQYLWDAHKLRNLLVHDPRYQMTHRQAVWAIEVFENVLRELGALS